MGTIQLHNNQNNGVTYISNVFIDSYMPSANGAFVKIYLYLLRCLQQAQADLSISRISDHFDCTEGDVVRALKYWEKVNLLSLTRNNSGQITDIQFLEPQAETTVEEITGPDATFRNENASVPVVAQPAMQENNIHKTGLSNTTSVSNANGSAYNNASNKNYGRAHTEPHIKKNYSDQELHSLQQDSNFETILMIVQDYMGGTLNSEYIHLVAFLYKELKFSDELIYHLFEYCIDRGKRRPQYIEAVAISWANENVKTPEDAADASAKYNADYSAVCKAFGLNRMPGIAERQYIDRWVKEFGFDSNIIVEACNRTLLKIQRPDFKYANGILEGWHKNGVKKFADIAAQDALHKEKQQTNPAQKTVTPTTNKFNAFPQRNYTKEDYSSIEKRLLAKNRKPK